MIERGATTAAIIKSLNVSPQYVYNIRSRLRKKTPPKEAVTITTSPAPVPTPRDESIQGEYSKYQQMTTWQRIKAAIGF